MLKMENWVQLRRKCSPTEVFTEIRHGIEDDVEEISKIYKENKELKFKIVGKNGKLSVSREGPFVFAGSGGGMAPAITVVDFAVTNSGISVKTPDGRSEVARLTLTDEAECKLKLESGEELNCWQFRKRFLEDMFFNIYPNRK